MHTSLKLRAIVAFTLLSCFSMFASAQTLKVLTAGAFKQVVLAFVPEFEAKSGVKVVVDNDTAGALLKRIQGGEQFDVIILPPNAINSLTKENKVDATAVLPIAKVAIGVAVKAGTTRPPLGTVEQFKETVLNARKVAYIDPASGGSSGIYLDGLFQRLGIAEAVRPKAVLVPGGLVAERIVTGEADLAIHQVSEILPVKGVELVGLLPEAIQNYTTYAGGISTKSAQAGPARSLIALLTSPESVATIRAKGMLPPQ